MRNTDQLDLDYMDFEFGILLMDSDFGGSNSNRIQILSERLTGPDHAIHFCVTFNLLC